jgi:hypothetical protein
VKWINNFFQVRTNKLLIIKDHYDTLKTAHETQVARIASFEGGGTESSSATD